MDREWERSRWAARAPDAEGPSLLGVANVLLRHRRLVLALPALGFALGVAVALSRNSEYTASSSFLPEVEQNTGSRLAGLASQLGVAVGGASSGESMEFYSELLQSRELLRETVLTEYRVAPTAGEDTIRGTLIELYGVEGITPEGRVRSAMARLAADVSTQLYPRAGLIELETTAPFPELAVQINRRMLELLNEFNLQKRQSKTSAERTFIEARLQEAQRELHGAEEEMKQFLESNRGYAASPQLNFEAGRIQRRLELRQQVYMSLAQAFEQAKVEEVRNTPVITLVERPEGSVRAQSRRLAWTALTGLLVGLVLAVGLAFVREMLVRQRRHSPGEFEEFVSLRDTFVRGLVPRPLRTRRRIAPAERTPASAAERGGPEG